MFEIHYDIDSEQIAIRGLSVNNLLKGETRTVLSVILEFKPQEPNQLISLTGNRPGAKVADTVTALKKAGIEFELSAAAKQVLEDYIGSVSYTHLTLPTNREV